jgi:hypothetical protein
LPLGVIGASMRAFNRPLRAGSSAGTWGNAMRLLVKVRPGRARTLALAGVGLAIRKDPLLPSVEAPKRAGLAAAPAWHLADVTDAREANPWDLCHRLMDRGLGATGEVVFAEPDIEQRWIYGERGDQALTLTKPCGVPDQQNASYPLGPSERWFGEAEFSQLYAAAAAVGDPGAARLRIAHVDTGYDPLQAVKPKHIAFALQKNFIEGEPPNDATDRSDGLIKALGHGTGTLGILAGTWNGAPLGGAAALEAVPIRIADFVVLFRNSALAQAFDYVHGLADTPNRCDVVTLSMGGVPSQAWADAVNALYEAGVFVVAAAGNNFGNLPTSAVVWPARFNRVVAACGAMADKSPYADLGLRRMGGNYGPETKMRTAMAAFTPNIPWARFGCPDTVDRDGGGTSSATPQVAAAAALWLQKNKAKIAQYPQKWMRVEAARHALFTTAVPHGTAEDSLKYFGRGLLRAADALAVAAQPAAALQREAPDEVSFPILQLLFGGGIAARPDDRQRMLEIEAAQLAARSQKIYEALARAEAQGPPRALTAAVRDVLEALADDPSASQALRRAIDGQLGSRRRGGDGTAGGTPPAGGSTPLPPPLAVTLPAALARPTPEPAARRLRVYAQDPLTGTRLDTLHLNQATLRVRWEADLAPGPVGEYLEVVDVDPTNDSVYAPVDLNHRSLLSTDGLAPSEGLPQFHQQMVYAVAMKTIGHFERALGRVALWSPRIVPPPWQKRKRGERREQRFVRRLRIYPHALREANAYYSPTKKALLFGYFPANLEAGRNLPRGTIFTCLSHDIVAHETAHALLDGVHPRFSEATNDDMLAFHEAFADVVALMQHFTMAEALKDAIRRTKGDLTRESQLGALAWQFGQAIGGRGALRDAIGEIDEKTGEWKPREPSPSDYLSATEAHARGAVLVAAVFDAFLQVYRHETRDLFRLASAGTGVLPPGEIPPLLVDCLAAKAAEIADRILDICIRALDYCPPVDMYFGEYLRALVTADRDVHPDDSGAYRVAFIDAFRSRGIYPAEVFSLSEESLAWEAPQQRTPELEKTIRELDQSWDIDANRFEAWARARDNARTLHEWLSDAARTGAELRMLGLAKPGTELAMGAPGEFSRIEVHSVRPARRIASGRQLRVDLVVELTQKWVPDDTAKPFHRGGSTLVIDADSGEIRYLVRKRVDSVKRMAEQQAFKLGLEGQAPYQTYFGRDAGEAEPFAIAHRNL